MYVFVVPLAHPILVSCDHQGQHELTCIPAMEDAHAVVLDLDGNQDATNTFFAVYDGHGGQVPTFAPLF